MKKLALIVSLLLLFAFMVACQPDNQQTSTETNSNTTDSTIDSIDTDSNVDTDSSVDSGNTSDSEINGENQNEILGPDWTLPQN